MSGAIDPVNIDFQVRGMADVRKAFATVEQQIQKLEKASTKGAGTESRTRIKTAQNEAKEVEKSANRASREAIKANKKITDDATKETKKLEREVARAENAKTMLRRRSSEMAGRYAAKQAAEEVRAAQRAADAWGRVGKRFGGIVGGTVGKLSTGMAGMASATLGIGGGALIADAVRRQMGAERASQLLINSATIGGKAPEGANRAAIEGKASQVSKQTGFDKTELIGAVQNYVAKSSDFKGGMDNMGFFAKLAKGSGTKLEDITGAAGILQAQNKDLSPQNMRQMLADMVEQGKQGAVEISDMAHLAGSLGSTRGLYAGDETDNQRKLLALSQVARTESESPEEAATSVKDMGLQALKKRDKLGAMGVKFTKGGQIASMENLIEQTLTGTHGDLGKIEEIFGARGVKPFMRLAPIFNKAGGGKAGVDAVRAEMAPVMSAHGSEADVNKQFDDVMSVPAEKFAAALNNLITTIEDKAEPYLTRFADKLPELIPKIEAIIDEAGRFASWFADNPIKGVGAIVLAAITKDLAAAGIGAAVKGSIAALIAAMGPGGVGGIPIPGGGGTKLGKALGGVGFAAIAGVAYDAALDAKGEAENMSNRSAFRGSTGAVNLASELSGKARSGAVTPSDIKAAEAAKTALEGDLAAQRDRAKTGGTFGEKALTLGFGTEGRQAAARGEAKNTEMALTALNDAIAKSTKALQDHATATNDVKGNPARHDPLDTRNKTGAK